MEAVRLLGTRERRQALLFRISMPNHKHDATFRAYGLDVNDQRVATLAPWLTERMATETNSISAIIVTLAFASLTKRQIVSRMPTRPHPPELSEVDHLIPLHIGRFLIIRTPLIR